MATDNPNIATLHLVEEKPPGPSRPGSPSASPARSLPDPPRRAGLGVVPVPGSARRAMSAATAAHGISEPAVLSDQDVDDAMSAIAETFSRADTNGVAVVDGWGCRLRVERGHLEVSDGFGESRRVRTYARATHGLSRLVIVAATGSVSLDAVRWCDELQVPLVILADDGRLVMSSVPKATRDARLLRAQARAADTAIGVGLARTLLAAKLAGQARNLRELLHDAAAAEHVAALADAMNAETRTERLRALEAEAAATYWQAWAGQAESVPRFASRDRSRVPAHWLTFDTRRSLLGSANGNKKAERPVNAILNYLFALVEVEATMACRRLGLLPELAVVHADTINRASLALDLIEPVRPEVEAFVLEMVAARSFRKRDFTEDRAGHVRLLAPLTHELAETMPKWAQAVAPWAERVAHTLAQDIEGKYVPRTPLTRTKGKKAQAEVKARKAMAAVASSSATRQRPTAARTKVSYSCPDCGGPVANLRRVRCDACVAADPRQTPALRANRARAISTRRQKEAAWVALNPGGSPVDPGWVAEVLRPALGKVKLSLVVKTCEVTKSTASNWRNGRTCPHEMHWKTLAELTGLDRPSRGPDRSSSVQLVSVTADRRGR